MLNNKSRLADNSSAAITHLLGRFKESPARFQYKGIGIEELTIDDRFSISILSQRIGIDPSLNSIQFHSSISIAQIRW